MKQILIRVQYKILSDDNTHKVIEFEKQVDADNLMDSFPKDLVESRHIVVNEVLGAKGIYITLNDRNNWIMLIKAAREIRRGLSLKQAKGMVESGFASGYMCLRVTGCSVYEAIETIEKIGHQARAMNEDELQVSETFTS